MKEGEDLRRWVFIVQCSTVQWWMGIGELGQDDGSVEGGLMAITGASRTW